MIFQLVDLFVLHDEWVDQGTMKTKESICQILTMFTKRTGIFKKDTSQNGPLFCGTW